MTKKEESMLIRYIKIWWILAVAGIQVVFQSRFGAVLFLIGKVLRFAFMLFFLIILVTKTKALVGYTFWQVILFYATFNLLDTVPQFLFRNVYKFRVQVVNGSFDNLLTKPFPALFFPLFGGSDILDVSILILSLSLLGISIFHIDNITLFHVIAYLILLANGFLLALAFHIFVLAIGVLTTAVDNTIMLYRDLTQMGRWPIEIYQEPFRSILTFVIPIGIMMTFPVKGLLGMLSLPLLVGSLGVGILAVLLSLLFWRYSLRKYTSASS